jgi:hypothetical protein
MSALDDGFQRVILGMLHHAPRQGLRQAVELANLLQAELRGLFVKDEELSGLAALPFVREFRRLEGGWRSIDTEELSKALDIAARSAERSFREAARTFNQSCEFDIVQGRSFAAAIASASGPRDVLVIPESSDPIECATSQFKVMLKEAFGSPASVLLVPAGVVREKGAIVALADAPDDPSIEVASRIAERAREALSVIDTSQLMGVARSEAGAAGLSRSPLSAIADALGRVQERLLVLSRPSFDEALAGSISTARRVPVLAVGRLPRTGQPPVQDNARR